MISSTKWIIKMLVFLSLKKKKIGNYSTLCKRMYCILESILECIVISICLMYTFLRGKNSILCTFVGGESHRGDPYTKGEKTSFYEKILFCFVLLYACFLIALWCFELLLISMLCYPYRIVFICWIYIHPYAIVLC